MSRLAAFYSADFNSFGRTLAQWTPALETEVRQLRGREVQLKDLSYLRWTDNADTMVVTFGEVVKGTRTGRTKRQ
jgi:L,D-transpeptidase YnhG